MPDLTPAARPEPCRYCGLPLDQHVTTIIDPKTHEAKCTIKARWAKRKTPIRWYVGNAKE